MTAFILTTVYRPYLRRCILNAYSLYFVLSLHTRDSDLNRVTETQTNRRGKFLFTFSYLSVVLYTKITKNMNLRNILSIWLEIRSIGTFVGDKQKQNTHVFDTTAELVKWRPRRDEDGRAMSSSAHARLSKFTSGSILDPRALVFYHVTDGDKSSGELYASVARIWLQESRSACSCFQKSSFGILLKK